MTRGQVGPLSVTRKKEFVGKVPQSHRSGTNHDPYNPLQTDPTGSQILFF